jgi:hypothetical protein
VVTSDFTELKSLIGYVQSAIVSVDAKIEQQAQDLKAMKKKVPPFNDAKDAFLRFKRSKLKPDSKEPDYFRHRLLFLEEFLINDRNKSDPPLDDITADDLTAFFELLPFIPQRHSVFPELKTLAKNI